MPGRSSSRIRTTFGRIPEDVVLLDFDVHRDRRGSFTEVFRPEWSLPFRPLQWSVVESAAGALRGMYVHARHEDYFVLLRGAASIGLYDLRADSPTGSAGCMLDLDEPATGALYIPRGILHGWYFRVPSLHLQGVSESYATYALDDNLSCHPADPGLRLPWPGPIRELAERDWMSLDSLRVARARPAFGV